MIPRSIVLIDLMLTVLAIAGLRSMIRSYCEVIHPKLHRRLGGMSQLTPRRALIYGADASAVAIFRALKSGNEEYRICGFIDPDGFSQSSIIGEAEVFSGQIDLAKIAKKSERKCCSYRHRRPGESCASYSFNVMTNIFWPM